MPARLRIIDSAPSLHERAAADLQFIRGAMERSALFTAVPGRGGMVMGAVALAAAAGTPFLSARSAWLVVWGSAAIAALAIGAFTLRRKAARGNVSLLAGPGRRFLLCLGPSLLVGALLTASLARAGEFGLLPGVWLLCYGAGVLSAGAFSVPIIPATGVAFLVLGALALAAPSAWGDAFMAVGFGGIHLVSGYYVAKHHGG